MSEEQNKATSEGEARVLSDDELKGIVGGFAFGEMGIPGAGPIGSLPSENLSEIFKRAERDSAGLAEDIFARCGRNGA